jgi:hypothetical protein
MAQSNGGISQSSRISAYPMTNAATGQAGLYAFDPTLGFNDLNNPANYFFRVEEVVPGKTPTVNKIIVTYRDLGLVTVTFNLTGTNDLQKVVSSSSTVILGNLFPTGRIMCRNDIGLTLTAQNLQLSISRAPGAGSLAIVKILMVGQVES